MNIYIQKTSINLFAFVPFLPGFQTGAPSPAIPAPSSQQNFTPLPYGTVYSDLILINTGTQIVDTTPSQVIGSVYSLPLLGESAALNYSFPTATTGDAVLDESSNLFWAYNGSSWDNIGENPGRKLTIDSYLNGYNESIELKAVVKAKIEVTSYDYPLSLQADVDIPIYVRNSTNAATGVVEVPLTGFGLQLLGPSTVLSVPELASGIQLSILTPSTALSVQLVSFAFSAIEPGYAGQAVVVIPVPGAIIALQSQEPIVQYDPYFFVPLVQNTGFSVIGPYNFTTYVLGTEATRLGPTPTDSYDGWNLIYEGSLDDGFFEYSLGFPFYVGGISFEEIYIASNGLITFGSGYSDYYNLGGFTPALYKFMFGAGDRSVQRVLSKSQTTLGGVYHHIIRWEGSSDPIGELGLSDIILEIAFFDRCINGLQFIELRTGTMSNYTLRGGLARPNGYYNTSSGYVLSDDQSWVWRSSNQGVSWTVNTGYHIV